MTKQKATLLLITSALLFLVPVIGYLHHKVSLFKSFETEQGGGVSGFPSVKTLKVINYLDQYQGHSRASDAVLDQFREWIFYLGMEVSEVEMPPDSTDALFERLSSPEFLRTERILVRSATPEQYRVIDKKPNCRMLAIHDNSNLDNDKLVAIAENFPALEELLLWSEEVEWSAFGALSELPIRILSSAHSSLDRDDAQRLAQSIPGVTRLNIPFESPAAVIPILDLDYLTTLNLPLSDMSGEFLRRVDKNISLQSLILFGPEKTEDPITLQSIFGIPTQSKITLLQIHGVHALSEKDVIQMATSFPNLTSIWITAPMDKQSIQVDIDALNAFNQFTALENLALPDAELTGDFDTEIHLPIAYLSLHETQINLLYLTSETELAINKALAHPLAPWALTTP